MVAEGSVADTVAVDSVASTSEAAVAVSSHRAQVLESGGAEAELASGLGAIPLLTRSHLIVRRYILDAPAEWRPRPLVRRQPAEQLHNGRRERFAVTASIRARVHLA
jgi:hypothetical protein